MNLRILEYFLMVAETGNITKAAEQLLMTQPTLSRQLKQLEEELGVDLFTRKNHHIELTEEGLLFRRRAQELVDLADKAKQELREESDLSGDLHIGLREGQSVKEISDLVQAFHQLYPAVHFHFVMGDNADIRDGLDRGELDFGLLLEPTPYGRLSVGNMDPDWLREGNLPPTYYVYGTEDPFYDQFEEQYQVVSDMGISMGRIVLNNWPHGFGADGGWVKIMQTGWRMSLKVPSQELQSGGF